MPLAFDSISHGTIAFGFFNIKSDMLLLDRYFFFADDFCESVSKIAEIHVKDVSEVSWDGYQIFNPEDMGDLMAAIHGIYYTGFIGEVYRRFPFPETRKGFKQKPYGSRNRDIMKAMIYKHSVSGRIDLIVEQEKMDVSIGVYRFERASFCELIKYVWIGGYPRWEGEVRPDYVIEMKEKIVGSSSALFKGISLEI